MADILLVEDKDSLRRVLRLTLEAAGYTVAESEDARSAAQALARQPFRLVLTDLRMPHGSGLDVLRAAREADPDIPVVLMTAYGSIDEAVQAMKDGAHDFLQKPVDSNHLLLLVGRALEQARLRTENVLLREEWSRRYGFPRIIGESDAIKRAVAETQRVATTEANVLLLGESGTGKELFARAVHHLSPRRAGAFVAVNCAAIPESLIESELFGHEKGSFTGATERRPGKFELASGGTIFLDEIGELPVPAQGKLLRAIEEKTVDRVGGRAPVPVDIRVVAATNRDLEQEAAAGTFRRDLYFRLAVFPVRVPPLRERGDDVLLLARHFAAQFGKELRGREATVSDEAAELLRAHQWPGNVRELENAIERACILADALTLTPGDLGPLRPKTPHAAASGETPADAPLAEIDFSGTLAEVAERAVRLVER
ncbi:MAG TPA: sigma-54 dependent transcriptional regulator, partial [Pyrinomonadaceae bacterium]|nr:sigma-54 dependent transcriptional regulator [Pyrinomonadaceae bacterium]